MNNELVIIDEREVLGKDFRIYGDKENPLFLAKDVAQWLGNDTSQLKKMLDKIDEDEKVRNNVTTLGGIQNTWFLTEDGLYEVLMQSRKPIAKAFKKEVKYILKAIRKDGAYIKGEEKVVSGELSEDELVFQAMNIMNKKISRLNEEKKELQLQNNKMKPIVGLIDKFISNDNCWDIGVLAKSLECQDMGKNKLFKWLRNTEILMANNVPYQRYVNYFKVIPTVLWNGDTHYKTLVRANGVKYIYNRLVKDGKVIEKSLEDILEYLANDN